MESKPSKVHNCSPPPGGELVKLGLRAGDVWICQVCGDYWELLRGVQPGGLLPISMQKPEWLRLNEPQHHTQASPYDPPDYSPDEFGSQPDESGSQPHDPGNPPPSG